MGTTIPSDSISPAVATAPSRTEWITSRPILACSSPSLLSKPEDYSNTKNGLALLRGHSRFRVMKPSAAVLIPFLILSCSPRAGQDHSSAMTQSIPPDSARPISKVLSEHSSAWMNIPGVTGTGETEENGKPAILILVDTLTDSLHARLPRSVDGYPVVIEGTGTIRALPKP